MSPFRPIFLPRPRSTARLLAAATALAAWTAAAAAQQAPLRGVLPDPDASAYTQDNEQTGAVPGRKAQPADDGQQVQPQTYQPVSPGPTDATAARSGDSPFDDDDTADGQDQPGDAAGRRTTAARARAKANALRLGTSDDGDGVTSKKAKTAATADTALDGDGTGQTSGEDETDLSNMPEARVKAAQDLPLDDAAAREKAIQGIRRSVDSDPFAAPGIRVGSFIMRPSVETGMTATSNADSSVGGRSAVLSESTLRLDAVSDWSRHSFAFDAYGTFRKSLSGEELQDTQAGADASLTLDLGRELRGLGTFSYLRRPDSASSAVILDNVASQPILQTVSGSAGLEKDLGKARFRITGRLEHDDYGNAELADGTPLSQKDRNSTLATVVLRTGYEVSPALTPFVEGEYGRRRYDQAVDSSGYERSADRVGLRAGVAVDFDDKIVGEISGGWIRETLDDPRLGSVSGPSISADIAWSPERETTLALAAATTVEGATTAGEAGSLLQQATLRLQRQMRSNLTGIASIGAGYRDFYGSDGHDRLFNAELGATYWLNRYAGLTGRLRYEMLRSNLAGRDYDATSVFLGLKLQR